VTVIKSPVAQLITSKRSCTLVNRTVGGSSSCFDSTEVGIVDADGTADEADTDGDPVDGDAIAIDAMVKREAGIREAGCVGAVGGVIR
jgi:hypothetical protein